jgi:fibronectin type 3 domain-containing protein
MKVVKVLFSVIAALLLSSVVLTGCSGGGGGGGGGGSAAQATAPTAPTGVIATPGNGQVTIAWTTVTGATSYNIYWSTTSGVTPATGTKIANAANPYIQTGLTNGTTYYYVVTAVNGVGVSPPSLQASAKPSVSPPPAAPTGVTATPADDAVTISWTAVAGAASYNIYWSTTSGAGVTGTPIANVTNPYVQTGLTNGTTYYYVVTAVNGYGESTPSNQVSATPLATLPPAAPTGVTATPGNSQVTIAWTGAQSATSYNIYWSITSGVTPANGTQIANATTPYIQGGLANGTTYFYVVTAVNGNGESAPSAQVSAIPSATPTPAAPTGVTATPGNGQVTIAWTAVPGVTSYNIYWSTTSGAGVTGTQIANVTTPYTQTGLTNGTTYYYVVTALNGAVESPPSTPQVSATPVLPAPTGVTATPGNTQVTIAWTAVTNAASYNIYWSTTPGVTPTNYVAEITGATTPYIQIGLINGTTYYYVVTAVNGTVESLPSTQVSATPTVNPPPPAAPTGVTATPGNDQVTIAWTAVTGATSYNIYWSTTSGAGVTGTQIASATNPYIQTGLTNGTTYYYVVTAVNGNGESAPSSQVSATPSSSNAPFIKATVISLSSGLNPFGWLQQVDVYTDSTMTKPYTNATVTVNGTTLNYDATKGRYVGNAVIEAGATVNLSVLIGYASYTATGTQYTTFPSVITPTSPVVWQHANTYTITWSAGAPFTGATTYAVGLLDSAGEFAYPANGLQYYSTSTATITPSSAGTYQLLVGIGTTGIGADNSGGITIANSAAGSGLWIGGITAFVPITVK